MSLKAALTNVLLLPPPLLLVVLVFVTGLALQLRFSLSMCALRGCLVSAAPG
jgi:hypothetical protein